MLTCFTYREGSGLVERSGLDLPAAFEERRRSLVWIDLEDPSPAEAAALSVSCGFHPLTVEDALSPEQPPKVEEFTGYLFVLSRGVRTSDGEEVVDLYKLAAFLGPDFLVTVHRRPIAAVTDLKTRVLEHDLTLERSLDRILHALVDRMVEDVTPLLDEFELRLEVLEESIFFNPTTENLQRILRLKRNLLTVRRAIVPQREVLGRLARRDLPYVDEKSAIYFRDVYDHLVRLEEMTLVLTDLATGSMEAHLSMTSNRLNEIMKVLTIFAAVWMPLTFLAGVYGMNLKGMPEMSWPWFYPALWGVMVAIAGGMVLFFRKKKWL